MTRIGFTEEHVRRVRAALAELGHPPEVITFDDWAWWFDATRVPTDVVWRAVCTAQTDNILCLACYEQWLEHNDPAREYECEATSNFVKDCGRLR